MLKNWVLFIPEVKNGWILLRIGRKILNHSLNYQGLQLFESLKINNQTIGSILNLESATLFFGNKWGSLPVINQHFHQWNFHGLQQIHSSDWCEFSHESQESIERKADAQYTFLSHEALYIRTADCIPLLLIQGSFTAAVHVGWKGLVNGILLNIPKFLQSNLTQAFIGPHIQVTSFEVGKDIKKHFVRMAQLTHLKEEEYIFPHKNKDKVYVHLACLVEALLQSLGISVLFQSAEDTFRSSEYFSYRREPGVTGRQISFIVKK